MAKNLRFRGLAVMVLTVAVAAPVFAAKNRLKVELREWNLTTSAETVSAGDIQVWVKNLGAEEHEIAFIRLDTDVATGRLPVDGNGGIVEENMAFGEIIDEVEDLGPGESVKRTINLPAGRYAIVCNIVEKEPDGSIEAHYSMGMHTVLNVE